MYQISETVWLALSADNQGVVGEPYDCNGYLVWDGETGVLVDAGVGNTAPQWLEAVNEVAPLGKILGVLLTHYHLDHAGGAAAAAAAGLKVFGSVETSRALAAADETVTQVAAARRAGVYPPEYSLPRCDAVQAVGNGDALGPLRVVQTPGHCDGHVVGLMDAGEGVALFSGDMLFAGGRVSVQAIPDCRLDEYAESVLRVEREDLTALYPGHGGQVLSRREVQAGVRAAAESFRRLAPPPNWLS